MSRRAALMDLLVVGGGINGVGIAREAAGRGLKVALCERRDLAAATSSASSKLIHGGLRYLEHYEFRLVRESLKEREVLLRAAPHLVRPLRFVLPVHPGLRPPWLLRTGLYLYDHIGGRELLPPTRTLRRGRNGAGLEPLQEKYRLGFEYSDCWADDSRLVAVTARDAAERGAEILVGWTLATATRERDEWHIELRADNGTTRMVRSRCVVNAAGPWVMDVSGIAGVRRPARAQRLVKGSHIVVPRLYAGEQSYTFQGSDKRICFVIPYENDFTLIGTTDIPYDGDPSAVVASSEEVAYLCSMASEYLRTRVEPSIVVWTYSGVRPLYDDGSQDATTVTRDYAFDLDAGAGAPLLSIFGGKLTTYRKLAEHVMRELQPLLGTDGRPWTHSGILPGGDLPATGLESFANDQLRRYDWAPAPMIRRMARAYGTRMERIINGADRLSQLGEPIAPNVYEAELDYLRTQEWARRGEDALWRRSKLGLRLDHSAQARITAWFGQ